MVDTASGNSVLTMDGQLGSTALWDTVFHAVHSLHVNAEYAYFF